MYLYIRIVTFFNLDQPPHTLRIAIVPTFLLFQWDIASISQPHNPDIGPLNTPFCGTNQTPPLNKEWTSIKLVIPLNRLKWTQHDCWPTNLIFGLHTSHEHTQSPCTPFLRLLTLFNPNINSLNLVWSTTTSIPLFQPLDKPRPQQLEVSWTWTSEVANLKAMKNSKATQNQFFFELVDACSHDHSS